MAQKIEIDESYPITTVQCKQIISMAVDENNNSHLLFCDLNATIYPCDDDITLCSICQCGHKVFFENEYNIFDARCDYEDAKLTKKQKQDLDSAETIVEP